MSGSVQVMSDPNAIEQALRPLVANMALTLKHLVSQQLQRQGLGWVARRQAAAFMAPSALTRVLLSLLKPTGPSLHARAGHPQPRAAGERGSMQARGVAMMAEEPVACPGGGEASQFGPLGELTTPCCWREGGERLGV